MLTDRSAAGLIGWENWRRWGAVKACHQGIRVYAVTDQRHRHFLLHRSTILLASCLLGRLACAAPNAPSDDWQLETFSLDRAEATFNEQFRNGEFEECIDTGKWILKQLAEMPDATPTERGAALTRLARAQQQAGRLDPAIQNFTAAINIIEKSSDGLSDALESPLWDLARALDQSGDWKAASDFFERALHLHTVNHGVQDPGMADLLQEVSEFYHRNGDNDQARSLQNYRVDLLRRQYDLDSLEILPALYDHAEMLEKTGDMLGAQAEYRDIMRRIVSAEGRRSHLMIPVAGKLANLFLYNEMYDGYDGVAQAKRYYLLMMRLAARNERSTTDQKAEAFLGMGDYYTIKTNNPVKSAQYYRKAWNALYADPETRGKAQEIFARPHVLNDLPTVHSTQFAYWRDRVQRLGMKKGHVTVRFDVGVDGRMTNVRIAESEPYRFKDFLVVKQLRRFVYRPALSDGEVVPTQNLEYRFEYAYWEHEYRDFQGRGIYHIQVAKSVD